MTANLPSDPPVNTDIDYNRIFSDSFIFCKCCTVSCAILFRRREVSAFLIMLSTKQGSHRYHFNAFGMARPEFKPTTSRSRSGCSTTKPLRPVQFNANMDTKFKICVYSVLFLARQELRPINSMHR